MLRLVLNGVKIVNQSRRAHKFDDASYRTVHKAFTVEIAQTVMVSLSSFHNGLIGLRVWQLVVLEQELELYIAHVAIDA
jgi:hypothetical protein